MSGEITVETLKAEVTELKSLVSRLTERHNNVVEKAYVTNDGETLSLEELRKRYADYEYRFTDDHR